ncbi:uncharacterized protein [Nicotiana sylvestris]|uniref:uncharacterized protein n=1 Tax=Nicotiana sylvestris TaxID=4096 RepID=UPI00388C8FB3
MQHISELKNKIQAGRENNCEFEATVKIVRSDNGTKFFNSQCNTLFSSLGIIHQSSCPYIPQQNGVVERKHKHTLEVARALKFQISILRKFWSDCVRTSVYLINKLPTSILQGKSPYDLLFGKPAKIDHLRVFGCLCYASNLPKDNEESSDDHETSDNLDSTIVHAESGVNHEIPTDASVSENLIPAILQPEVETNIEEVGPEEVHLQRPSIEGETRKSTRQGRPPVWLKDFITNSKTHTNFVYSISNALSYCHGLDFPPSGVVMALTNGS